MKKYAMKTIMLILTFAVMLLSIGSTAVYATDGQSDDYYRISTAEQLHAVRNNLNGKSKEANSDNSYEVKDDNTIKIGDYITLGTYLDEPIIWRCVDIDENGPLMLSDKILCFKSYDAAGDYGNYLRDSHGSNNWYTSSLNYWLNSSGCIDWSNRISKPNDENSFFGYNSYADEIGFLSSFSAEEKLLIKSIRQKTYLNNLDSYMAEGGSSKYDSGEITSFEDFFADLESKTNNKWYYNSNDFIFLLGPEQAKAVYDNLGAEYLVAKATEQARLNDESATTYEDTYYKYWLRLPANRGMSYENLRIVDSTNQIYFAGAHSAVNGNNYQSIGVRPAFYLNLDNYDDNYDVEDEKTIAIFTTEKSLSVQTNKSMWLAFGLMEKGKLNGNWKKMAITVSDPTVIELSEYEETEYGYSIEVIGKKQGTTTITITDTTSGINTSCIVNVYDNYTKSYTYNITGISTVNDGLSTNIYDLNGLYVSNYKCISNGSYYYVSMDIYNNRYHTGAVDVYDANDKWIASYPIEKYSDISSLWDTGEQAFYLVSDWVNNRLLTYKQASFAKHTPITNIEVPEGGYIVISNNFSESVGTFFYNASEILFEATVTWLEAAISLNVNGDLDKSEFIEMLMGEILKDPNKRNAWIEIFNSTLRKELETFATKLLIGETSDAYSNFADDFEDVLNSLNIEWKHLFQSATGLGESAFTKFAGPAGVALEACFAFTGYGNKILRAIHIATSIDEPYVTAFSSVEEGYINPHGVVVNTGGNIDAEAVLQVFKVSDNDTLEVVLDSDNPLEKYELYNISFVKNDKNVQPNGNVKVYIPIPKDMIGNASKIYRQENDGSWTMLDAHIEDNYLVFETEHFSLYAIIGNTAELIIEELPSNLQYVVGDTLNTEGLVLKLNEQLITTGYICGPTILSECGEQEITVMYGSSTAVFNVYVTGADSEQNVSTNIGESNKSEPSDNLGENNDASIFDILKKIPKEKIIIIGTSIAGIILLVSICVIVNKKRS